MKNNKHFIISLLFVFFFTVFAHAQKTHTVTLICYAAALEGNAPAYQACSFEGQEPGTDTRDYTIYVNVGDTIIWQGASIEGDASIDIKKIKYDRGTEVFDKDELDGESTVVGTVKKNTEGKPDYKYKISFKVDNTGQMHAIDPKVSVKP